MDLEKYIGQIKLQMIFLKNVNKSLVLIVCTENMDALLVYCYY